MDCGSWSAAVASHFHALLRFLAMDAEQQIAFAGAALPADARDWLTPAASEDQAYDLYWTGKEGNPLLRLSAEFEQTRAIFDGLDENILPDTSLLDTITRKLNALAFDEGVPAAANLRWGANQLRELEGWQELRVLSRHALAALRLGDGMPQEPFEQLLFD